jgi:hypothetical protein
LTDEKGHSYPLFEIIKKGKKNMIKKFIQLLALIVFFGTPLVAMPNEEFEDASIPRTVTKNPVNNATCLQDDLSDWGLVGSEDKEEIWNASIQKVARKTSEDTGREDCLSGWYLMPVVKTEPSQRKVMDIFDVFSLDEDTIHPSRKTLRGNNIPMVLLGITQRGWQLRQRYRMLRHLRSCTILKPTRTKWRNDSCHWIKRPSNELPH